MYMEILQLLDSVGLSLQKLSFSVEETCHCRSGMIKCNTICSDLHVILQQMSVAPGMLT